MDNFIYVVADTEAGAAVVVDPGWDAPAIATEVARLGCRLEAVWLTHGHHDHTSAVAELIALHPAPVYLSAVMPHDWRPQDVEIRELRHDDRVAVGGLDFRVLHTPGHSPDGLCFYRPGHLVAGDTLFIDGCGRCDLPNSDVEAMYRSLHTTLAALPAETVVYPGHDYGPQPVDTLGNQRRTNRFLLAADRDAFIRERMG